MIYYNVEKGAYAKRHFWSVVNLSTKDMDMDEAWRLSCCHVPEYYMKNKRWDSERLTENLNDVMNRQEYDCFYLHPVIANETGVEERLPPEILLEKLLAGVPCWEYVSYIGSDGVENTDMLYRQLGKFLPRINHFTLVTNQPEWYEDFAERLYDEYGIPTAYMHQIEKRCGREGRTVIIDGRRNCAIPYTNIPEGAVYVDLWSAEEKKIFLGKMRRDINYMSVVNFLDTIAKNGYNTIVN